MKPNVWSWLAGLGAGALIVGSFMPWVKIAFVTASGVDGGDGWITIVGGFLAALIAFKVASASVRRSGLLVVGTLMSALTLYEFVDIKSTDTGFGEPMWGVGLYVVAAGAVAVFVAGLRPPLSEPIAHEPPRALPEHHAARGRTRLRMGPRRSGPTRAAIAPTNAVHVGGARRVPQGAEGYLDIGRDRITFDVAGWPRSARSIDVEWSQIESIQVLGSSEAQSALAGTDLAFGALGLFSSDGENSYLAVHTAAGLTMMFEVKAMTPIEMTAQLRANPAAAPMLRDSTSIEPPMTDAAANGDGTTPADALTALVEMHDRGALTDEEFTAAKRQLLGM